MRIGVVQFATGSDKTANLVRLGTLVSDAAGRGAEVVVAPEASMHGFGEGEEPLAPYAEPLDGSFVSRLGELASTHRITLVAGMFETVEGDRERAYNTVVAVGPDGALLGRSRKVHLFDALGWTESKQLAQSPIDPLVFDCGDLRLGLMTCYDLRFPELSRVLVDAGATVLVVPSAWVAGEQKVAQWQALMRARAIENTAYVVGAGQTPPQYVGHSTVVDPFGIVLVEMGEDEGVAEVNVTAERVAEVRARMPSLRHRRFRVEPA